MHWTHHLLPPVPLWLMATIAAVLAVTGGLFAFGLSELVMAEGIRMPELKAFIVVALTGLLAMAILVFWRSTDRLRLTGNLILWTLPIAGHVVPPGRFGISVFDLVAAVAAGVCLAERRRIALLHHGPLIAALTMALVLLAVPALTGINPLSSLWEWLRIMAMLPVLAAIIGPPGKTECRMRRITAAMACATIIIALGIFIERGTGINFSSSSEMALNALQTRGIHRAAGLFQDPQKAAQFLGCLTLFLAILLMRGAIPRGTARMAAGAAVALGIAALILSVSRASLLSALAAFAISLLLTDRPGIRFGFMPLAFAAAATVAAVGYEHILPESIAYRLQQTSAGAEDRLNIWIESWHIFEEHPVMGIGPGNYQENLMRETPILRLLFNRGEYVPDQPENGYLKILYEAGIFGAAAFLLFVVLLIRTAWRYRNGPEPGPSYVLAASCSMLVFAISFFTLFSVSDQRNLLIVIILTAVLLVTAAGTAEASLLERNRK